MANKVLLKKSSVVGKVPTTSDLSYGELALNYADGKLYFKDSSNLIKSFTEDSSVVTLAGTQSLSNKTLVNPLIEGKITSKATGGDEGGEILLEKAQTNTSLVGAGVTIDVYQNKLRIFEQGGSARGVYIDLTAAGAGVSTNLLTGGTSGTGPDADTLDGYDSSYFLNYNNLLNKPTLFSGDYNDLTNKPSIPSLTGYATETYVNTQVASLVDSSPETLNTLNELAAALGDDPNFAATVSTQIGLKANSADLATVATSGSYNDLTNKPTIPTVPSVLSAFTNDVGFITSYTETDPIYTASSWYSTTNNSSNWNTAYGWGDHATAGYLTSVSNIDWSQIVNEPALFSGDYNDLTNKPTIPTNVSSLTNDANYATQSFVTAAVGNKQNTLVSGINIKTINGQSLLGSNDIIISQFSGDYNDLTNKPTNVSAFTNDANYVNTSQLATKQNTLVSGTNIKTINGQSLIGSGNISISGGSGDGLYTNNVTLTTTAANQQVDSYDITQYRTVKYLLQAIAGADVHTTEVTVTHNDNDVIINEYGTLYTSSSPLISVSADIDLNNVYLKVSPLNVDDSETVIDLTRISIVARVLAALVGDLMLLSGSEDLMVTSGAVDLNV